MKRYSILGILAVAAALPAAAQAQVSAPAIEQVSTSLQGLESQVRQARRFDPVIGVNPNLGAFATEIAVPLPPNLAGFGALKLVYQAQSGTNNGLGVGWQWNLPVVRVNAKTVLKPGDLESKRVPYVTDGLLGPSELVATHENLAPQASLINGLFSRGTGQAAAALDSYRPAVDENFTLYVRVRWGNEVRGWVALTLDGQRWAFDETGTPVLVEDRSGNGVRFVWENDVLTRVEEGSGQGWVVSLAYARAAQRFPVRMPHAWQRLPLGLRSITTGQRELQFVVDSEGYLLRAGWRGGSLPVFQASYSLPDLKHRTESNALGKNDGVSPLRPAPDRDVKWLHEDPSSPYLDMYVDLNGDGRPDRVRFNIAQVKDELQRALRDSPDAEAAALERRLDPVPVPSEVDMAVQSSPGAEIEYRPDPALALDPEVRPFRVAVGGNSPQTRWAKFVPAGLFFVDLNGDGRKDLVYCPADNRTDTYHAEASGRTFSNAALEVLSWFRPDLTSGLMFTHLSEVPGSAAHVYYQAVDEQALARQADLRRYSAAPAELANYVTGYARWEKQEQAGFDCHAGSLFIDANHDGRIDVLTGSTLFLAGATPGEYEKVTNVDLRHELFEPAAGESYDMSDAQLIVADVDGDGKLEARHARAAVVNEATGELELYRNGVTEISDSAPSHKLLTEVRSPYGGRIQVKYAFKSGAWVVRELVKDPSSGPQPVVRTVYDYKTGLRDPFRGELVGFAETEDVTTVESDGAVDERASPARLVRQYFQDTSPGVILFPSRSRLNGRLKRLDVYSARASDSGALLKSIENHIDPNADLEDVGNGRLFYNTISSVERTFEPGTDNVRAEKIVENRPSRDQWATDSNGNNLFPLEVRIVERGNGIPSIHSDSLTQAIKRADLRYSFTGPSYLRLLSQVTPTDRDLSVRRFPTRYTYDAFGRLASSCEGDRCSQWTYDGVGRLIETREASGSKAQASYPNDLFPLPSKVSTAAGTEQRSYDPLSGLLLSYQTVKGAVWQRAYLPDGTLVRVTGAESAQAPARTYFEVDGGQPKLCDVEADYCELERRYRVGRRDFVETWEVDGFGRVESVVTPDEAKGNRRSGKSLFGEGDTVIARTMPAFGAGDTDQLFVEYQLDALGRTTKEVYYDGTTIERSYNGACVQSVLNGYFRKGSCSNPLGGTTYEYEGDFSINLASAGNGDLLEVPELGLTYDYSKHGELVSSRSTLNPLWSSTRSFEIEAAGDSKESVQRNDTRYQWRWNESGQLVASGRDAPVYDLLNYTARPSDVAESLAYEQGQVSRHSYKIDAGRHTLLDKSFTYDAFGSLTSAEGAGVRVGYESDIWGQPTAWRLSQDGRESAALGFVYKFGRVSAVKNLTTGLPLVSGIERDVLDRDVSVSFGPSLKLTRTYQPRSSHLRKTTVSSSGKALWSDELRENDVAQITQRISWSALRSERTVERFSYDSSYQLISETPAQTPERDAQGRATRLAGTSFEWNDDNLAGYAGRRFYYDATGSIVASCAAGVDVAAASSKCFLRLGPDTALVEGTPVSLVRVDGTPIAVVALGKTYPIAVDHLGSVRALFSPDGTQIYWERRYGAWGDKHVTINPKADIGVDAAAALERLTLWSFAGLIEVPGADPVGGAPLYWSSTRVYSPASHEWMSPDPLVKWNPSGVSGAPGNWHAVRYANGQPLMYVDPTGRIAWFIVVPIVMAVAAGASRAYAKAHAPGAHLSGMQITGQFFIGFGISAGATLATMGTGAVAAACATALQATATGVQVAANLGGALAGALIARAQGNGVFGTIVGALGGMGTGVTGARMSGLLPAEEAVQGLAANAKAATNEFTNEGLEEEADHQAEKLDELIEEQYIEPIKRAAEPEGFTVRLHWQDFEFWDMNTDSFRLVTPGGNYVPQSPLLAPM